VLNAPTVGSVLTRSRCIKQRESRGLKTQTGCPIKNFGHDRQIEMIFHSIMRLLIFIVWYNIFMNTAVNEIEHIKEILPMLPETALHELRAFTDYLADRERRRKALVERVLKAEQNPDVVECRTPEEFMQAIRNAPDDDEG